MSAQKLIAILSLFVFIFFVRNSFKRKQPRDFNFRRDTVDLWEYQLHDSYFKGIVQKIGGSDNNSRYYGSIYLELIDSIELNIPDSCEYLKFKNGSLVLDAHYQNIYTDSYHTILRGDIVKKNKGVDSIYVFEKNGAFKYCFELFDGIKKPLNR